MDMEEFNLMVKFTMDKIEADLDPNKLQEWL